MKTSQNSNQQFLLGKLLLGALLLISFSAGALPLTVSTASAQVVIRTFNVTVENEDKDDKSDKEKEKKKDKDKDKEKEKAKEKDTKKAKKKDKDDDWDDDDGWDDVEEDDAPEQDFFANWQTTHGKVMGAKRFLLQQEFQIATERVDAVCELDPKQLSKLNIASKGGVKKLIKEWETATLRMFGMRNNDKDKKSKPVKEKKYTDIEDIDSQTMQVAGNGFMSQTIDKTAANNPFWKKTLRSVLTDEQEETWKTYVTLQQEAKREAMVDASIETFNLKLGLTPDQKMKFTELVRPQMMKAKLDTVENVGPYYEKFLYFYYASKTSDSKIKKVLSEAQFQGWKMIVIPSKAYAHAFGERNVAQNRRRGGNNVWAGKGFDFMAALDFVADAAEEVVKGVMGK